jgi:hypothetical protein
MTSFLMCPETGFSQIVRAHSSSEFNLESDFGMTEAV